MQTSLKVSPRFSPVAISPGTKVSQGINLTGLPRRIRDSAADIHSSIQQWNNLCKEGVKLLKIITSLKVDLTYSEEIKTSCEDLEKICDGIDSIVENLELISNQMKAASCLHKTEENLFATWPMEKFVSTSQMIYEAYKKEAEVKKIILENVAHDSRDAYKMLHLAAWIYQSQIPESINTSLEAMLIETKLR